MSRSNGRATAQKISEFAQNLDNCMRKLKKYMHVNLFFMIHKYYVILGVIFALFLAQHFRTKVLTAQKNLLLECLHRLGILIIKMIDHERAKCLTECFKTVHIKQFRSYLVKVLF